MWPLIVFYMSESLPRVYRVPTTNPPPTLGKGEKDEGGGGVLSGNIYITPPPPLSPFIFTHSLALKPIALPRPSEIMQHARLDVGGVVSAKVGGAAG